MAAETLITSLNFNDSITGISFSDNKTGLSISLGYVSGLPPHLAPLSEDNGGIGLALMDKGIGQHELDQACQKLCERCEREDFTVLVTKCDFPFDARWFLIGALQDLIEAARKDRISLPFSDFLYDELLMNIKRYKS